MPVDCEDRFSWECGNDVAFKDGKHLYGKELVPHHDISNSQVHAHTVVYAVRAAIFDAYKKKEDLQDSILYTTLHPCLCTVQSRAVATGTAGTAMAVPLFRETLRRNFVWFVINIILYNARRG